MEKSIEEKLSAIKAINERKESVERTLANIIRVLNNKASFSTFRMESTDNTVIIHLNDDLVKNKLLIILKDAFETEQRELIAKAEELMK